MRSTLVTTLIPLALAACASNPAPVNLTADPTGMQLLAGEWSGTYSSRESGRTGSIVFTLIAGEDHAHGDVLMIPVGYDQPLEPYQEAAAAANQAPRVLTIDFVSATGKRVTGTLAPYRDPACGCPLATTFEGEIKGDRITGKFQSYHTATGERQSGEWQVDRKKPR
jgi:hypothetical protein